MTAKAFVLVNVDPALTQAVAERLRAIRGAVVYEILGPYDLIVDLEAETPEDLAGLLRSRIRAIAGVRGTLTCTVMPFGGHVGGAHSAPG